MMVKRERDNGDSSSKLHSEAASVNVDDTDHRSRRGLRSRYLAVKNKINDEKDEIARPESDKFDLIFSEMESLHELVTKPREQVADAQALLDITKSLVMSVKAHANGGLTPSEFVSHLLKEFGGQGRPSASTEDCTGNSVAWKDIGLAVSYVFKACPGCCTMFGPLDAEIKQKKAVNRRTRKRARPTELARPEELDEGPREERADTDKIMLTMFNILGKNKVVKLENLVLNRNSFAQTVENLFALSFLVKDGRAEIKVNEAGWQLVSPRNAPDNKAFHDGDVARSHFVFRFDFNDWKLMADSVGVWEELMPHRDSQSQSVVVTGPLQQKCEMESVGVGEELMPQRDSQSESVVVRTPLQQKGEMKDNSAIRNQVSNQRGQELVRGDVQVASDPNNQVRKSSRQRRENSQLKEFVWGEWEL